MSVQAYWEIFSDVVVIGIIAKITNLRRKPVFQHFIYYTGQAIKHTCKILKFTVTPSKYLVRKPQFCSRFQLHL